MDSSRLQPHPNQGQSDEDDKPTPPFTEPEEASTDPSVDAHQATDTDVDPHEAYDAGLETASYQMHRDDVEEGRDDRLTNKDVVKRY